MPDDNAAGVGGRLGLLDRLKAMRLAHKAIRDGMRDPEEILDRVMKEMFPNPKAIDPDTLMKWIEMIMKIIEMLLGMFT